MTQSHTFYRELASWWPLISPPEEYAEEAACFANILRSAATSVSEVLELGSGGGNNAAHLKHDFTMTLVDLSEDMLAVSKALNPECRHEQGDMRTVRLGREFDAVFVHDAIGYMLTEQELAQAVATAAAHCRPGGVALFVPDDLLDTYRGGSHHGGTDGSNGQAVRYLEWSWDPDPSDATTVTHYVFLLREADGSVTAVHEAHQFGIFSRETWLRTLERCGFEAEVVLESTSEDRPPREMFVGYKASDAMQRASAVN